MFTKDDLLLFESKGLNLDEVQKQLRNFGNGFPFLTLVAPATIGKGVVSLNSQEQESYINIYNNWQGKRIKFVPASGAATRMFKSLYEAISSLESGNFNWSDNKNEAVRLFFENLDKFAFFEDLKAVLEKQGKDIFDSSTEGRLSILKTLLMSDGLNYGGNPKGLLLFHKYKHGYRTAVEEHLVEAGEYANDGKIVKLHFTVSPEHKKGFLKLLEQVLPKYETKYGIKYNIDFSEQKISTDTIAVTPDLQPFRENGTILFRPAGHGALLENLNEIKEEIIFIKNIDNVIIDHLIEDTIKWKKVLAGYLINVRQIVYQYLENINSANFETLGEILNFVNETFCSGIPNNLSENELREILRKQLDRPLRVCGMVKNEGEPGGGPFIVKDKKGRLSLQIAESSQIDLSSPDQHKIFDESTHFNPVDLVCSVYNHKGNKYNLLEFRDPETGFISEKTKDGKKLKAQELPGLWNGAMSNWNTIFVETPLSTFNPVKTVNDLLKREHQPII